MLDRMLGEAAKQGYDGAVQLVNVGNTRARKLYADKGFSETGELHRFDLDFVFLQRAL
jgi:L-amino acid N-acyltransferase YncA